MGEMTQDDAYRTGIAAMAEELRTRIAAECRSLPGTDKDRFAANLAEAEAAGRDGGEGSEIGNLDAADARCGGRRL